MYDSRVVPNYLHKKRIDSSLVSLKLVKTRQKALALIMSGNVFLNEKKILKPGSLIFQNSIIKIKKKDFEWVSRGGIKLNEAIEKFNISVKNKICLDVGCSTGGFSDVLLKNGAKLVYAVDVGYGQFDWKLRNSKKIKLFERTNAKF